MGRESLYASMKHVVSPWRYAHSVQRSERLGSHASSAHIVGVGSVSCSVAAFGMKTLECVSRLSLIRVRVTTALRLTSGDMYSGVPHAVLHTDCVTSSLLYPKSHSFTLGRGCRPSSRMLSSCAVRASRTFDQRRQRTPGCGLSTRHPSVPSELLCSKGLGKEFYSQ